MSARRVAPLVGACCLWAFLGPVHAEGGQLIDNVPTTTMVSVVNVATEAQLQAAVQQLRSDTTIVLASGTYVLTSTLWIRGPLSNVTVRGASRNRDDVTLIGTGMQGGPGGPVPYGIWAGEGVDGVTIANLTIRDVADHAISFAATVRQPRVFNVHLANGGAGLIESLADGSRQGAPNGIVEHSLLEYTTAPSEDGAVGIDVHGGFHWTIRDNVFIGIASASGLSGQAVRAADGSRDTVTERNSFVNSARGIAYGVKQARGFDHSGGIIRNNFFFRAADRRGAAGISIADSPSTEVANNTVFVSGTYPTPIEYQFPGSADLLIVNNLLDGIIAARDGAAGAERNNLQGAAPGLFVDAAAGDLRLKATATDAIDRGVTLVNVTDDWGSRLRPAGEAYDIGADEYGAARTGYAISGTVLDSASGDGVAGMTVNLTGARTATATTDATGAFTFSALPGHVNYSAVPASDGQVVTPARVYFAALNTSASAVFTATAATAATPTTAAVTGGARITASANRAPTVKLTAPADGSTFTAPATITVTATANDRDTSVARVDFYAGATLIGTDKSSSYRATWSNVAAGSYTLTAVATDTRGLQTRSDPIAIQVKSPTAVSNQAPTVSVTSPNAAASYTAPVAMTVSASAADKDGSVSKVDFYADSTLIGSKTSAPWQVTWNSSSTGTIALTAVATDNRGATTRSAAVSVTIKAASAPAPAPPAPAPPAPAPPAPGTSAYWIPPMATPWQWQLTGTIDQSVDVPMYDIDLFDVQASVVASLHAKGRHVVCYMSAGTFEDWRPDAADFPAAVKGSSNGWPGEKWLDIRRLDLLAPIMAARMDLCKSKGFDAIEPDNVDGYANRSGFPLTETDQIAYNKWLATAAHSRGLSIGLKNDLDQVADLVSSFDWALNEQCFQYNECSALAPFTQAGKAVFEVEYSLSTDQFCSKAIAMQFNSMKKGLDLDPPRTACTP